MRSKRSPPSILLGSHYYFLSLYDQAFFPSPFCAQSGVQPLHRLQGPLGSLSLATMAPNSACRCI